MLMVRRLILFVIFPFIVAFGRAQIPSDITVIKNAMTDQNSATDLVTLGYSITVYVTYPDTVPATATVDLQAPNGTSLRLTRGNGGLFVGGQAFQTRADLEAAYPDGTYTAALTDGTTAATTTFTLASGTDAPPLLIANYQDLQGSTTARPLVTWEAIPGATSQDYIGIAITRTDGTVVFSSTTLDATTGRTTVSLPNATPLRGGLAYARFNVAYVDNRVTRVRTGRGISVGFSLSTNVAPPLIWEQPADANLTTGDYYSLTVKATGSDSPTYQWYRNGVPVPNATAPNYPISARVVDSGTYTVAVTNPGGTVTSDPAVITVTDPTPTIETQPSSAAVSAGESVRLSVTATGAGALSYQWSRDGSALAGATGSTLAISAAQTADAGNYTVAVTDANGTTTSTAAAVAVGTGVHVTTYAGTGDATPIDGPINSATFLGPGALGLDAVGNLYVVDGFAVRRISADGIVSTLAGAPAAQGFTDGTGMVARFHDLRGLAVDGAGNVYVSDWDTIRQITPTGVVSTVAGVAGVVGAVDGVGASARFSNPSGVVTDAHGNVYIADWGNHTVREMTPMGLVTTVAGTVGVSGTKDGPGSAAEFQSPRWLALDGAGDLIVADGSAVLRRIATDGMVSTIGGMAAGNSGYRDGIGANAGISTARDAVAVGANGTIYFVDSERLRQITPAGVVQTIAGGADLPFADGYGTQTNFAATGGMVMDGSGTLYIADTGNHRVRKVTFVRGNVAPEIRFQSQPSSHTASPGAMIVMTAPTTGHVACGTWEKDGVAIAGATGSTLTLDHVTAGDSGTYTYVAANIAGTISTQPAVVDVSATATPSRIVNLSVRSAAGLASDTLLAGFAVSGPGGSKQVLARAIGPALTNFGVSHALPDPTLTVNGTAGVIATDDNWPANVGAVFSTVGAFPLTAGSADSASIVTLQPGTYTLQVGDKSHPGVAAAEIYDLEPVRSESPRLVNVSARTRVGTGDAVLITGFTVLGDTSETLLIRGVGRTLQNYGVASSECLADPEIEVRSGDTLVAANDNWSFDPQLHSAFQAVGAFELTSATDAAVLVTLNPGTYTVEVDGVRETRGIGLVEVYEVP